MNRKLAIILLCLLALFFIVVAVPMCSHTDNSQAVRKTLAEDSIETEQVQMLHERHTDSLINVACGIENQTLTNNRQHALDILKKEYPELSSKWAKIQQSIDNLEVYSDEEE